VVEHSAGYVGRRDERIVIEVGIVLVEVK